MLTSIDAKTKLLPDDLTLPLVWAGLLVNSFNIFTSLESSLYGAVFGYLSLWSMYWIFKLVTGKEGMGYGDFKLLAALCAWFGIAALPTLMIFAAVVGSVVGICVITASKKGADYQMPFGPYLAGAGLLVLFFDQWTSTAIAMLLGQ
jgi:leader peptidase (prepilin peptidase)/N-methyltransferase